MPRPAITLRGAILAVRALGYTLRYDTAYREYTVRPRGGGGTIYYTDDRMDAIETARDAAARAIRLRVYGPDMSGPAVPLDSPTP